LWHDVRSALRQRVRETLGSEALRSGLKLTSMATDDDAVTLRFGADHGEEVAVRAKLVLACDGIRSTVRALSAEEAPAVLLDEGKSVWRGVAPGVDCNGEATFYKGEGGESALIFPAGREHGSSWTVIAPVVDGRSVTQEEARSRLSAALPADTDAALLAVIAATPVLIENKLVTRDFSQPWSSAQPRVAYLGDAAHPLRPTGEGTALALEDAWTLGDLLRDASEAQPGSLRAFENARRERVRAVSDAVKAAANRFYESSASADPVSAERSVSAAMKAHPMPRYTPL